MVPTASQTVGPFFHLGCTETRAVSCLASSDADGEHVQVTCRVLDGDGMPVSDAMVELWQANAAGKYNHPEDTQGNATDPQCCGFGRLETSNDGICTFETVKPGRVPGNDGTLQAPHLSVSIFARGVLKRLATRIYFAGDPANDEDPILALVPVERRATLMAVANASIPSDWHLDIHLCGEHETVFFDI
ncbi:MAG TPA: protocatechuate 3,4-dioxygenase subunit alpha [Terriglobales bacterium]|nr:protocatechuate 3,4-dioxygenase subunit alpha [Terriglobales bacterium]